MIYRRKVSSIEAMLVTPDTVQDAAKWCGGRVVSEAKPSDPTDVYTALDVPTLNGAMRVQTYHGGEYLVRSDDGSFRVEGKEDFESNWQGTVTRGSTKGLFK